MKKTVLILLINGALCSSGLQAAEVFNKDGNRLDLYGRMKADHQMSKNNGVDGDNSYARIGFKGQTQINDALTGYGQWEYQVATNRAENDSSGTKTRLGFAGLRSRDYGSLDYGRGFGVLYEVGAYTDMLPDFGDDAYIRPDNFMNGRSTGLLSYRNDGIFGLIDGLRLTLQYQGKNENDGRAASRQNGDGFGTAVSYDFGETGISAVAAYARSDRTNAQMRQNYGHGSKAESWGSGLKYDDNNVYLAATYAQTRNMTPISGTATINGAKTSVAGAANKVDGVELVAQYQFDFGLRPSIAWIQSKAKDVEGIGNVDLAKYFDLNATYYFNKNISTFVEYKINQLKKDNELAINNNNVVSLGIMYQF